jgi:hypothetical protein
MYKLHQRAANDKLGWVTIAKSAGRDMTHDAKRVLNQCLAQSADKCDWSLVLDTHRFTNEAGWCPWARKQCE